MKMTGLLDCHEGQIRLALTSEGKLTEIHYFESDSDGPGQFYRGRVLRREPSLNACFVDIGAERPAFLPEGLNQGETVLVQSMAAQETRTKGLRLTRSFALTGRAMVLLPNKPGIFVSSKIQGKDRIEALKEEGRRLCPPGFGIILRTCFASDRGDCEEELQMLLKRWSEIETEFRSGTAPGKIGGSDALRQALGRLLPELDALHTAKELFPDIEKMPELQQILHRETDPLFFDRWSVDAQVDRALRRQQFLPGGGILFADFCEACTVYDVNSGKDTRKLPPEEKALRINLEAVSAVLSHIRLLNLGGMILVDLIDMKNTESRQKVLALARQEARRDSVPCQVLDITPLGILEITRKRTGFSVKRVLTVQCPKCQGSGTCLSPQELTRRIIRDIQRRRQSGQNQRLRLFCSKEVQSILPPLDSVSVSTWMKSEYRLESEITEERNDKTGKGTAAGST